MSTLNSSCSCLFSPNFQFLNVNTKISFEPIVSIISNLNCSVLRCYLSETFVCVKLCIVSEHSSNRIFQSIHLCMIQDLQIEFVIIGCEELSFKVLLTCFANGVLEYIFIKLNCSDVPFSFEVSNKRDWERDVHPLSHFI